jgi:hypothetical protein
LPSRLPDPNSALRIQGSASERNIYGSTTLVICFQYGSPAAYVIFIAYSITVYSSVAEPDLMFLGLPDPDPYLGGSRSGFFNHQAKIVRKNFIPIVSCFLYGFLSL